MGPRGDAILQFDDSVGTILATLDKLGLRENTLVLLSSDNGPVVDDGYKDDAVEKLGDHKPAGPLRGGKYSSFEGGTRVPFIVRWPAKVKPGVSPALVCQVDFPASFAALTGQPAPAAAVDSQNVLPALLGQDMTGRAELVEQGGPIGLRQGHWKFIPASPGVAKNKNTNSETGNASGPQLYDLSKDLGERQNQAKTQPDQVQSMTAALEKARLGPGK